MTRRGMCAWGRGAAIALSAWATAPGCVGVRGEAPPSDAGPPDAAPPTATGSSGDLPGNGAVDAGEDRDGGGCWEPPACDGSTAVGGGWGAVPSGPGFFVAPNGNDANDGSMSAPFKSLERAQSAMRESATKATYLRAGLYQRSATLLLTSADDGESWQYFPPDGVNSAVLDGGATNAGNGVAQLFYIHGGSHIMINGLKLQNFDDYGILGDGGPNTGIGPTTVASGNTAANCDIGPNTGTAGNSSGIGFWDDAPNTTIANNVHDFGSVGIGISSYGPGSRIDGSVISGNVLLRCVQRVGDVGATGELQTARRRLGARQGSSSQIPGRRRRVRISRARRTCRRRGRGR